MRLKMHSSRFRFFSVFFTVMIIAIYLSAQLDNQEPLPKSVGKVDSSASKNYPAWMDEVIDAPSNVSPKRVYTFTCEFPTRKPDVFTTACADFGEMVGRIEWQDWSLTNAVGNGIYAVNDCDPSCAEGKSHETPVRFWLDDVTTDGKNYFLNTLKVVPIDQLEDKASSSRNPNFFLFTDVVIDGVVYQGAVWDVSKDWKEFPELREDLPD